MSYFKIKIVIIDKFIILECLIKYFESRQGINGRIFLIVLSTEGFCLIFVIVSIQLRGRKINWPILLFNLLFSHLDS